MSKQFFVTEKQLDEFKKIYDDIYEIVYGVPEPLREFIYAIEDIRNQPDSATEELAKLREQTRWRNTDTDGWPKDGEIVEFIISYKPLVTYPTKFIEEFCTPDLLKAYQDPLLWRPLDLPEMMKEAQR